MKAANYLLKSFFIGVFVFNTGLAEKITNIDFQPNENQLYISWDALTPEIMKDAAGYAVQWSDRTSDIDIQTHARLYQDDAPQVFSSNGNRVTLTLGRFDRNLTQYLRVYTYAIDDNDKKQLGNGSDRIKWKIDGFDRIETETTVITDPVIVVNDTSSDAELVNIDFGSLRILEYDNFADLYWSKPSLALESDYDGFLIHISAQSNLEDEDKTTEIIFDQDADEVRITGLSPATDYYAQGHIYKAQGGENKFLGSSDAKSFKTIEAIPRDGSSVASRNLAKIERKAIKKVSFGSDFDSNITTNTNTNTSNVTLPITSTSQRRTTSSDNELQDRISAIQLQIRSLERELSDLQKQLGENTSTSTSSTYTNTKNSSTTSGMSTRDRVRAALAARRNQ